MNRNDVVSILLMVVSFIFCTLSFAEIPKHQVLSKNDLFKTAQKSNLEKVFIHQGVLSDKLVFSFSGNPICTYMPKSEQENILKNGTLTADEDGQLRMTFFVPLANIKGKESKKVIQKLSNEMCDSDYCVHVKEVKTPIKGIEYSISFAPEKRGFEYLSFKSITGQKGIMFKFHNHGALKKVRNNTPSKIKRVSMAKKKVILDFGHGGRDAGYSNSSVKEKEINFQVGMHLAKLLKKKGHEVCLIRNKDEYLSLDKRTEKAHRCGPADALISLHSNSAHLEKIHGIETFCHIPKLFSSHFKHGKQTSLQSAALHNKTIDKRSGLLAQAIHSNVLSSARSQKKDVVDRKVKHQVTQLLLGSEMPSILIELGFLTNKKEASLLQSNGYQKTLAQGIVKGLDSYFKMM